jgi:hypothetical protein
MQELINVSIRDVLKASDKSFQKVWPRDFRCRPALYNDLPAL